MKKCDLHIHSCFSDSDMDVEAIFKRAESKGLCCIAITDHDTLAAIEEAKVYSQNYGIELIEGVELSATKEDTEIHVLGYFIDSRSKNLGDALVDMRRLRVERLLVMVDKLIALGKKLDKPEFLSRIENKMPTRLHLGLYLMEKGVVPSLWEAFRKYLSPGKPAYAGRFKYSVPEAIQLIKAAGGLAFLAHPFMLSQQFWIDEFVAGGMDGLEVVYPRMSEAKIILYRDKADSAGLLKSGGSDGHGSYKKFTNVGDVTIPYEWVEEMKRRIANRPKTIDQRP